jgi:Tfp pilus assembly protein PilP
MTGIHRMALGVLLAGSTVQAQTAGQARAAQAAASQAAAPAAPAPAQTGAAARPATPAQPGGRRDPFRPLVVKATGDQLPARLPPGKAGLVIGQLTIQGIVRGLNSEWIAVVDNKTKRAYFLYVGDELYNGAVTRIAENEVVFQERFTDAAGQQRMREVVKQMASQ